MSASDAKVMKSGRKTFFMFKHLQNEKVYQYFCNYEIKKISLLHMNNHICSTLFKIKERKADRRSKEIEQRKESQNKLRKRRIEKLDDLSQLWFHRVGRL